MKIRIEPAIVHKLATVHNVQPPHVAQAFLNRQGTKNLIDTRPEHATVPPTLWFLGKDVNERLLKVVFMYFPAEDVAVIKTCYEPNQTEIEIYEKLGR